MSHFPNYHRTTGLVPAFSSLKQEFLGYSTEFRRSTISQTIQVNLNSRNPGPQFPRYAVARVLDSIKRGHTPAAYRKHLAGYKNLGADIGRLIAQNRVDDDDVDYDIAALINNSFDENQCTNLLDKIRESNGNILDGFCACDDCSTVVHRDNMSHVSQTETVVCENCLSDNYVWSEYQNTYLDENRDSTCRYYPSARAHRNGNYDSVCTSQYIGDLYEHDGEYYSQEAYYDLGLGDEDEDEDEDEYHDYNSSTPSVIRSYHSTKDFVGHIPSSFDNRGSRVLLGLEMEFERVSSESKNDCAKNILDLLNREYSNYCGAESDGSLDDGFEIVTGYTGLDVHAKVLEALKDSGIEDDLEGERATCGLHVHVDKADMSPFHGSKMIAFIHSPDNRGLIEMVARRYGSDGSHSSGYAKFDYGRRRAISAGVWALRQRKDTRQYNGNRNRDRECLQGLNSDRYEALNFQNPKTVEFRLFQGTTDYETIMACLEFSFATWHFCRQSGLTELTDSAFCAFLVRDENRRDTEHLRSYLQKKGHQPLLDIEDIRVAKDQSLAARVAKAPEPVAHTEPARFDYGPNAFALAA